LNLPTFLLLYLNKYTFSEGEGFMAILESCLADQDIKVVLVHEHDVVKGGCKFDVFFKEAPEYLIDEPCKLFQEIATKLYSEPEYRTVSLRQILTKMGH